MLFLVISTPAATAPSEMAARRKAYWHWIDGVRERGELHAVYSRAGRGAVAVFDLPDNAALHARINEWAEIVPAEYQVIPLIDAASARAYLDDDG